MRQVVEQYASADAISIIKRVQDVGLKLIRAQPKELAVGNIVRRVLGVIRDEAEENRDDDVNESATNESSRTPGLDKGSSIRQNVAPSSSTTSNPVRSDGIRSVNASMTSESSAELDDEGISTSPPAISSQSSLTSATERPVLKSMFSLLSHPMSKVAGPNATPGSQSASGPSMDTSRGFVDGSKDIRAEAGEAIGEIIDELDTADDQIAGYALDHIHAGEVILTYTASVTVQKFLLKAAGKRKFTVICVEAFPNEHEACMQQPWVI